MTTNVFAQRLKELRTKNGLSLEQMAEKLKVTAQSLSLYERAQRTIHIDLLSEISKQFNVSADYLIGLSDVPSLDTNIQAVCEYTGLSEKAIKMIKQNTEIGEVVLSFSRLEITETNNNFVLNTLLENNDFWELFVHLWFLRNEANKDFVIPDALSELVADENESVEKKTVFELFNKKSFIKEQCELSRYKAQRTFEKILDVFDVRKSEFETSEQLEIMQTMFPSLFEELDEEET